MATINWDFELPLRSEGELKLFVNKAWGVTIPDTQVCSDHTTPWRAFADAYFAKAPVTVWKASRGFGGKSYLLALLGLTEAVTLEAGVNVLGGSLEQSNNVLSYVEEFWDYESAPTEWLLGEVRRETRIAWGNTVRALTASSRSVRGPHRPRLRLDEIDEMDLAIFDAAMGQTMAKVEGEEIVIPAQTVASSTHQYADGTMSEVLARARANGWPIYEWCMRETSAEPDGWLLQSEIERKRAEVPASMWNTEYELQEPEPKSRAIQPEAVETMFDESLGEYEGRNGQYLEFEEPEFGASYSTGTDWAKKQDWTVIMTSRDDVSPKRVVAFERLGRKPWPVIIGRLDQRMERYGGRSEHDETGLGNVVDDYMENIASVGVTMVGRGRSNLLTNYIAAIEDDEYVCPMIEWLYNEYKYASVDDVYGSGHLPDGISAGCLMHDATRQKKKKVTSWRP